MIRRTIQPYKIAACLACLGLFTSASHLSAALTIATNYEAGTTFPFTPAWTPATNSLIAGLAPSVIGPGNFSEELTGRNPATLTQNTNLTIDKTVTSVYYLFAITTNYVTCGGDGGSSLTYTLPASANGYGYDITNITVFGGWVDNGRDAQGYTVYYSTMAAPTNFIAMTKVSYQPGNGSFPTSTRVMLTDSAGAPLAMDVVALKFDFTTPTEPNGYQGYSQIGVFGVPSNPVIPPILPTLQAVTLPNGDLRLTGIGGTPNHSYTLLTTTNPQAPMASWTVGPSGNTDGGGAFSTDISANTITNVSFFRLRMP